MIKTSCTVQYLKGRCCFPNGTRQVYPWVGVCQKHEFSWWKQEAENQDSTRHLQYTLSYEMLPVPALLFANIAVPPTEKVLSSFKIGSWFISFFFFSLELRSNHLHVSHLERKRNLTNHKVAEKLGTAKKTETVEKPDNVCETEGQLRNWEKVRHLDLLRSEERKDQEEANPYLVRKNVRRASDRWK